MKRIALAVVAAAVATLAACQDDTTREESVTSPTEPLAAVQASDVVAVSDSAAAAVSSVCAAYVGERSAQKALLVDDADDADAKSKVTALDAMIADACH